MATEPQDDTADPPGRRGRGAPAARHTPRRITRLRVARLVGAAVVAILGQFAVDMPGGWFGTRETVTDEGLAYCAIVLAAVVVDGLVQFFGRRRHGRPTALTPVILSVNIGAFVPALATDPTLAGAVVLWQLVALARHFLDRPKPMARRALARHFDPDAPPQAWLARYGAAVRHLVVVALVAWVSVIGYQLTHHPLALLVCTAINLATIVPVSRLIWLLVKSGWRAAAIAWVPLVGALFAAARPETALTLLAAHQAFALYVLLRHSPTVAEIARHFYARPALFVVNTFGGLIVVGAILLTFPVASGTGTPIAPLDAFFTSTSAVCVTGLIVKDTPVDFSTFGHVVLLLLIQVGGLGIMVLSTFATVLLGGRIGLREERALGEYLDTGTSAGVQRLALFIIGATFTIEGAGAAALYPAFRSLGETPLVAAWHAVFHSVSAFCNAGFALRSDSLVVFRHEPWTLGVFALLITLGGIGFAVLSVVWARIRTRERRRVPVQVRLVVAMSLALSLGGALLYAGLEWNRSLAGLGFVDRVSNALFQSVTLRTAGFNSVDFASLAGPTALVMSLFMLIGASPGGTGGGIKTTTTAILALAIPAIARGETRVTVFGRTVPQAVVYRSAAIASIALAIAFVGVAALAGTQTQPLERIVFEISSAIGTVGLSMGVTPTLDPFGKYVVILMMFIGRVGPLTLALSLGRPTPRRTQLPEENIAVG